MVSRAEGAGEAWGAAGSALDRCVLALRTIFAIASQRSRWGTAMHVAGLRPKCTWLAHCFKGVAYRYHRPLEPLFQSLIAHDSLVLDIGAHSGQFSKIFARCANQGLVLAVEPAAYPLSILRTVKRAHRWRCVEILEMGVSDRDGSLLLRTPLKPNGVVRFGLASVARDPGPSCTEQVIPVTTVDALTARYGRNRRCAFIKADIEGHEYAMLVGAKGTIDRDRPALFLEVSADARNIDAFLRSHGYVIFRAPEGAALHLHEWEPIRNGNVLAIHASRTDDVEHLLSPFRPPPSAVPAH